MINNLSLLGSIEHLTLSSVQCRAVQGSEDKQTTNLPVRSAHLARAWKVSNAG